MRFAAAALLMLPILSGACVTRTVYVVDDRRDDPRRVAAAPSAAPPARYEDEAGIRRAEDFYEPLSPYGRWVSYPGYGMVFVPSATVVGVGFRPYTYGHWEYTEWGWTWVDHHPFGWATGHYGRWFYDSSYGWVWVPGTVWSPAWVTWRTGGGYIGWAPMPPGAYYGGVYTVYETSWVFVGYSSFGAPYVGSVLIVGPAYRTCYAVTYPYQETYVVYGRTVYRGPPRDQVVRAGGQVVHRPIREVDAERPVTRPPSGSTVSRDGREGRTSGGDNPRGTPRNRDDVSDGGSDGGSGGGGGDGDRGHGNDGDRNDDDNPSTNPRGARSGGGRGDPEVDRPDASVRERGGGASDLVPLPSRREPRLDPRADPRALTPRAAPFDDDDGPRIDEPLPRMREPLPRPIEPRTLEPRTLEPRDGRELEPRGGMEPRGLEPRGVDPRRVERFDSRPLEPRGADGDPRGFDRRPEPRVLEPRVDPRPVDPRVDARPGARPPSRFDAPAPRAAPRFEPRGAAPMPSGPPAAAPMPAPAPPAAAEPAPSAPSGSGKKKSDAKKGTAAPPAKGPAAAPRGR
jgi:hypothetical protein